MEAIERVIAGPERKSRLINEEEKRVIAYHEAGHAVVINALPEADTVQKVSIISRGEAGGYTMAFPEEDRVLKSRRQLESDMIVLLGGRAAEEIVFSDITSGASNDLERVTKLARTMVMRLGMSVTGLRVFNRPEGYDAIATPRSGQKTFEALDQAINAILEECYAEAKRIISEKREAMERVTQSLLQKETLTREEFEALV